MREDIRELTRVQELDQLALLERLLADRSGDRIVYSTLARQVRVSENTIRSWISTLCGFHHGFLVRTWFRNVGKALRKEPKWYLRDWSGVRDGGKKAETFCACHLLKTVETWSDLGLGSFELRYIRDKQGREVDFVIARDNEPWFLVEVKLGRSDLSGALAYFQQQTRAAHAFQVVVDADFTDTDCFSYRTPVVVPAKTLLSQLV